MNDASLAVVLLVIGAWAAFHTLNWLHTRAELRGLRRDVAAYREAFAAKHADHTAWMLQGYSKGWDDARKQEEEAIE